jgi:hypothetical protein
MQVGLLGDIIFEVSDNKVQTISNAQWSGSANWQTHQRHLTNALTEFTGINPDKFSCDIVLSNYLGVQDVQTAIAKLWTYERNGTPVPLTIGKKGYGKYRWSVLSHSIKLEQYDRDGNVTSCTVTVQLQEYLKG